MPEPTARYDFEWDPRFRLLLAAAGIHPGNSEVTLTAERLVVRFGHWSLTTPLFNIVDARVGGPYSWYRTIGARLSMADRGVTFGTSPHGGVCIRFDRPVPALEPLGLIRHPGLTVTVVDPDGLATAVEARIAEHPDGHRSRR